MKFQDGAADIFLAPGELVVCRDAVRIRTILGSCIAVCLWDRRRRVGGVNHYLLPRPTDGKTCDNRFGSVAIPRLIAGVCRAGGAPVRQETGGDHGRGLLFNPHTGELTVRRVRGWAELAVEGRLR
jgi:chemotaxis receptor (MCP) glutamine deamidase CheD